MPSDGGSATRATPGKGGEVENNRVCADVEVEGAAWNTAHMKRAKAKRVDGDPGVMAHYRWRDHSGGREGSFGWRRSPGRRVAARAHRVPVVVPGRARPRSWNERIRNGRRTELGDAQFRDGNLRRRESERIATAAGTAGLPVTDGVRTSVLICILPTVN